MINDPQKDIPCLVLGIGNILWADEGFGVRAVEAFHQTWAFEDPNALVCDGGTLGMYLFDRICRTKNLLIFDCCDFKGKPGEMRILRDDEIAVWTSTKISPHQTGMNDLLCAAALQDCSPTAITVIGVQPIVLDDYGGSLTPQIKECIPSAVRAAHDEITKWNFSLRQRAEGEKVDPLMDSEGISLEQYEKNRPVIEDDEKKRTRLKEGEF